LNLAIRYLLKPGDAAAQLRFPFIVILFSELDVGRRHRGAQRLGTAALVEAAGATASGPVPLAADQRLDRADIG
jgi:hypothetical protein